MKKHLRFISQLAFVFLLNFISANFSYGQSYPGKIGVNMDSPGGVSLMFVDAVKEANEFEANGGGSVPKDANGWPLADCQLWVFDFRPFPSWAPPVDDPANFHIDVSGTYKVSWTGVGTLNSPWGNLSISNRQYNAGTNTSTADLYMPPGDFAVMFISITGTSGGIKDLKIIRPGYPANTKQVFRTELLNALTPFSTMRFMDYKSTNGCDPLYSDADNTTDWNERKLPTDATQKNWGSKKDGGSWEYIIELANITGKDIWLNIPASATDDYVTQLATLCKNNLDPNIHIYLEHSNEVWNGGFPQWKYNQDATADEVSKGGTLLNQGTSDTYFMGIRRHLRRSMEIGNLFKGVYGAAAMNNQVRPIYAIQTMGWPTYWDWALEWINTNYGPPSSFFYGMAEAPYIPGNNAGSSATVAQILASMMTESDNEKGQIATLQTLANKWGMKHICYETGPDHGGGSTDNIGNRILSNRDPGMKDVLFHHYRDNWFGQGGDLMLHYGLVGAVSRYGCWGALEDVTNLNVPKYQALCELSGYCSNPPSISITSPTEGSSKGSPVTITVNATDADGSVSKVEFFSGSTKIGESTTAPFNFVWSPGAGTYAILARATDNTGKVTFSTTVNFSVTVDTQAPSAPTLSSTGKTYNSVSLSWTASSDNVGVTGYDLYQNSVKINSSLITGTTYNVTGLSASTTYDFTVKASDAAGNVSVASNTISVTTDAAPDTQAPSAPTLSSTGKTYNSVSLSWTASSDNVGVTGYDLYNGSTKVNSSPITGTTYTVTGLNELTTYSFTVKASDAAGNISVASNTVSVTTDAAPDTQAPSAPTLSSTGKTYNSVSLSWTASSDNVGVTGYDLYQNSVKINSSLITGTTYTVTGLSASTTYDFTVKASDAAGNISLASNTISVTTDAAPDTQAPSAPTLSSTGKTYNSVSLSWTASSDNVGVTGYDLYSGSTKVNSSLITGTTYAVTGLNELTTYTFTVKASDAAGNVSVASNSVSVTTDAAPDTQAPSAPTLSSTGKTYNSVSLSWTASSDNVGVTGYDLYQNSVKINSSLITGTTYTVTGLSASTTYDFTVKASDAAGNISVASNTISVTTDAAPDTQAPSASTLSSTGKSYNSVSLSWTASSDNVGVTGYNLYNGSTKVNSSLITGTTYTVTGLNETTTYDFTVKASDAAGNISVASNTISVTTDAAPDTQAPSAPTLSSTGKTYNSVSLSWTGSSDNVGVIGYDLYNGSTKINSSLITGTTYNVTGLNATTTYSFTVKASDAAGNVSIVSNSVSVTTDAAPDTQAPSAPTLSSAGKTYNSVSLSWTASSDNVGVTGYDLYQNSVKINSSLITGTTYTVTGLSASTTYDFTVKASDAAGNISLASNTVSVTTDAAPDTQAPSAPTLSSTGKTYNSVSLSWTASSDNVGVTGYDLYQNSVKINSSLITGTTYTVTGLSASTTYDFTVKASDAAGNVSVASNSVSVTTDASPDTQAPSAPTLSSTGKTYNSVSLSWTASSDNVGVTGYDLYQNSVKINSSLIIGTTYTVTGLSASTTYDFTVKASDAAGNVSVVSNSVSVTTDAAPDTQAPSAPTLSSRGKTYNSVSLSWTGSSDNVGVTGYDLYQNSVKINSSLIIGTTYTVTGLSASTTYDFTVKASDAAGNVSVASNSVSVTTDAAPDTQAPSTPTLSSTGKTYNTISLSWTASSDNVGVTGYDLYNGSTKVNSSLITGTTYTVTGLNATNTYSFTVKASDAAGNVSVASNTVSVTTDAAPDTQAPSAPTLSSSGKTYNSVSLSWTASSDNVGVTGYDLYNNSVKVNSSLIIGTTYAVTGLNQTTTYSFTVKASDAAGNASLASNTVSVTTDAAPDTQAPSAPTLSSTGKTYNSVSLSWTASSDNVGVTGYDVYNGSTKVISSLITGTTYSVTGLNELTTYNFTVKASDAAENVSVASNTVSVTTNKQADTQAPTSPTLSTSGSTSTSISLIWTASSDNVGVTGYDLYNGSSKVNTSLITGTSYTVSGLNAATTYTFTVKARDAAGNTSPVSNALSVTTSAGRDKQAPSTVTLSSTGKTSNTISLSWTSATDNVGVVGYDLYNGKTKVNSTYITGTSYTVTGLNPNTSYSFTVKASDAAGNVSGASNHISATTDAILTAISPGTLESSISTYPNPSNGIFTVKIENEEMGNYSYIIFDIIGTNLFHDNISKRSSVSETSIDITNLPDGVYYLSVNYGNVKMVKKIIKL